MRDRGSPWRWPICIGLALGLLFAGVLLVPDSWIRAFFSPLSLVERLENEPGPRWLVLTPPPQVQSVPDTEPEPPLTRRQEERLRTHLDPDWWSRGWLVRAEPELPGAQGDAAIDSVAILLAALGVERDFMTRARPDSVLASRLFMLKVQDSLRFDELKPYLSAMARSRDYADMMSRKADIFDDFLGSRIMTPD